jgi:hypothetical protein
MDGYYDLNGVLGLQRQDNSQGGERWLTPYRPINVPGDGGAFTFNFFDGEGRPVGFARRSELTMGLYYYDLEANLIGTSADISAPLGTQTVYAGDFYFLF